MTSACCCVRDGMDLELRGKTAIVTGGAKGIGYEITRALLQEGCRVCMAGTDQAALERARSRLCGLGPCMGQVCDVADGRQVRALFAAAAEAYGTLDILVNNAGTLAPCRIEQMEEADWDRSLAVNLKSVFLCTQAAIAPMKPRGGVIINAASSAALIPSVGQSAYAAAKAAVKSFTQTSAAELAPYGIRVLAYIPGVIATHLIEPLVRDPARGEKMRGDIALRRFGTPEEVASVAVFLASPRAGYMSGCSVEIHGGKLCVQNPAAAYQEN